MMKSLNMQLLPLWKYDRQILVRLSLPVYMQKKKKTNIKYTWCARREFCQEFIWVFRYKNLVRFMNWHANMNNTQHHHVYRLCPIYAQLPSKHESKCSTLREQAHNYHHISCSIHSIFSSLLLLRISLWLTFHSQVCASANCHRMLMWYNRCNVQSV